MYSWPLDAPNVQPMMAWPKMQPQESFGWVDTDNRFQQANQFREVKGLDLTCLDGASKHLQQKSHELKLSHLTEGPQELGMVI